MSRPIRLPWLAAVALSLSLVALLAAQRATNTPGVTGKIGVVDTEHVMTNSAAGGKAIAHLQKLQKDLQDQAEEKQRAIADVRNQILQGQSSLAETKLAEMQRDLEAKTIAMRRWQDDASRNLNKTRDDMIKGLEAKVMPVINKLAQEEGYSLIFRKYDSSLIYSDETVDITAQVIKRMDAAP